MHDTTELSLSHPATWTVGDYLRAVQECPTPDAAGGYIHIDRDGQVWFSWDEREFASIAWVYADNPPDVIANRLAENVAP